MEANKLDQASVLVFYGTPGGKADLKLQATPLPLLLGQGEILAKIRLCSICGSDLHTLAGKRSEPVPSVLGHEAVAEVISVKNRTDVTAGDRVTFSVTDSCGQCDLCLGRMSQKCVHLFKYGHAHLDNGSGINGCYSSHILLRKGTAVIKIPDHVSDRVAVSANCALATMVNAVSNIKSPLSEDQTVVIQGSGMLGLYGCALLRERGYQRVFCTDIDKTRLDAVSRFGGIPWNTATVVSSCPVPAPDTVDTVVEVCGIPEVVQHGIRLLRPGGLYILVGMVTPESRLNITGEQIIRKCLTLKGVHNYTAEHLQKAVDFLACAVNTYPFETLVSQPIRLTDFEEAFSLATTRKYQRVVMQPDLQ